MSTTPYKNYSQAHEAFLAAWEAMQRLPDAPNEDAIALDGLRAVLPLTTKRKLIHNYRYREVAAVVEAHGGTVEMRSVPGDTCFIVRVPLAPAP